MKNKISLIIILAVLKSSITFSATKNLMYSLMPPDTPRLSHYNNDTMLYLEKDFNDSVAIYKGKSLKNLLKKVELTPKYISYIPSIQTDSIYDVNICFVTEEQSSGILLQDFTKKYFTICVTFDKPILTDDLIFIQKNQSSSLWTRQIKDYLQNRIIKSFKFYPF